jgi:hypothetical protein
LKTEKINLRYENSILSIGHGFRSGLILPNPIKKGIEPGGKPGHINLPCQFL